MVKVAVIGLGRVGTAMGAALTRAGHSIVAGFDTDPDARERFVKTVPARAAEHLEDVLSAPDVLLICVPDDAVKDVADELSASKGLRKGTIIGHASGALSSGVLSLLREKGCSVFSMHPIQTFLHVDSAVESFSGSYFGIEGDPDAVRLAEEMVNSIGGKPIIIDPDAKPLYHAALSTASNFLVALLDLAVKLCQDSGIEEDEAVKMVLPLVRATLTNFETEGVQALTGPIERGDAETVKAHLKSIVESHPDALPMYRALAEATIGIAQEKGTITAEQAEILTKSLHSV